MQSVINGIVLLILLFWIFLIYFTQSEKMRTIKFPYKEETMYVMSPTLYFTIFTVCTAPFFLQPFTLLRYAIWLVAIMLLIINGKLKIKMHIVPITYIVLLLWILLTITYTTASYTELILSGYVKYCLPLFFFWLGYNAIDTKYSLMLFMRFVIFSAVFYSFWIGGLSATFYPSVYFSPFGTGLFLTYAGLADYFTSLFPIPILLFFITKRKIYLIFAILLILSTILEAVRTGIGGIAIASTLTLIGLYKQRSVPIIFILFLLFAAVLTFVPSIKEKMFFEENVKYEEVVSTEVLNKEDIRDNGRYEMWERALNRLYKSKELIGSGVGSVKEWLSQEHLKNNMALLLHNDYVLLMCETGLIGLTLYIIFIILFISTCFSSIFSRHQPFWPKIGAILAVSSFGGILFSMGYDNVFGHSLTSLVNPFLFFGFFLKLKEIYGDKTERTHSYISES